MILEEMRIPTYIYNFVFAFSIKKAPDIEEYKLFPIMSKEIQETQYR